MGKQFDYAKTIGYHWGKKWKSEGEGKKIDLFKRSFILKGIYKLYWKKGCERNIKAA